MITLLREPESGLFQVCGKTFVIRLISLYVFHFAAHFLLVGIHLVNLFVQCKMCLGCVILHFC